MLARCRFLRPPTGAEVVVLVTGPNGPHLKFLIEELQPKFLFGGRFHLLEEAAVVADPALYVE